MCCAQVEVVEDASTAADPLPPGAVTFYNSAAAPLSNFFPAPINMDGKVWQGGQSLGTLGFGDAG